MPIPKKPQEAKDKPFKKSPAIRVPIRQSFLQKNESREKLQDIKKERAYIEQGHVGIMKYSDKSPVTYLTTSGLGPCVGLVLYNPSTKQAILAHIDSEITRNQFNAFLQKKDLPDYKESLEYKKIISEYKKMQSLLSELSSKINNDSGLSKIQASVVYTQYHESKKDGYPLKAIFEDVSNQLRIPCNEILHPDADSPRRDDEDISIHLFSGKVARYSGEDEVSILIKNHVEGFEYYKITPSGELSPKVIKPPEQMRDLSP